MTSLRTNTNASAAMAAALRKTISPSDIIRNPACKVFSVMESRFITGTSAVSAVSNLAASGGSFVQATGAAQPALVSDTALGQDTLELGAARDRHMAFDGSVNFNATWSMLAVFNATSFPGTSNNILGDETSTAANRASLQVNSSGQCRVLVGGTGVNGGAVVAGNWYAAICSYVTGTNALAIQMPGRSKVTGTAAAAPTGTINLRLGDSVTTFGFNGRIDMAAFFDVDLFDAGQADLLADCFAMLQYRYGPTVNGQT
jgi:hypothetical protein